MPKMFKMQGKFNFFQERRYPGEGKYNPYRIVTTVVNIALFLSFAFTAFCGMSMSGHAVPFLYGMTKVSFARRMHLSMSHWAFIGTEAGALCRNSQMKTEDSFMKI